MQISVNLYIGPSGIRPTSRVTVGISYSGDDSEWHRTNLVTTEISSIPADEGTHLEVFALATLRNAMLAAERELEIAMATKPRTTAKDVPIHFC